MATSKSLADVQKGYVAFYQRPADPAGQAFWAQKLDDAGGNLQLVIDQLANSTEAARLYFPNSAAGQSLSGLVNATTITDVVTQIYQNLLGRAPDASGLQFYVDGFKAGTFTPGTIALAVINGVQNQDVGTMNAKLAVAQLFSDAVDGRPSTNPQFGTGAMFAANYMGDADAQLARTFLQEQSASASASQVRQFVRDQIAEATDPLVTQNAIAGTPGADLLTGTTGSDLFLNGPGNDTLVGLDGDDRIFNQNLSTDGADEINLGAGNDSLRVTANGASQIRLTFTSANVGNGIGVGTTIDTANTVKMQAEDGMSDILIGAIANADNEGMAFEAGAGITLDVRDVSGVARGDQFKVAVLGTNAADLLDFSNKKITYYVNAGQGNDSVYGGSGNDFLVGGAGNDVLMGNAGNDSFIGGAGNDTLVGSAGNDRVAAYNLATDGADDINLGDGDDTVALSSTGASQIRLTFTSANVGNGTGVGTSTDSANTVKMQAEDGTTDMPLGSVGSADDEGITFVAATGITFDVRDVSGIQRGDQFNVAVLGSNATDNIDFSMQASNYYVNAGQGNDMVNGGSGNDFLVGGAGDDVLLGNAGNDSLLGGGGADAMTGGMGNDVFIIAAGATGLTLPTADKVMDFATGTDRLSLGVAGSASNFLKASSAVADFASALAAANMAFASDVGGPKEYVFQFDGTNGYLFLDRGAAGDVAKEVIVLVGLNSNGLTFSDITA